MKISSSQLEAAIKTVNEAVAKGLEKASEDDYLSLMDIASYLQNMENMFMKMQMITTVNYEKSQCACETCECYKLDHVLIVSKCGNSVKVPKSCMSAYLSSSLSDILLEEKLVKENKTRSEIDAERFLDNSKNNSESVINQIKNRKDDN